MTDVLIAGAGVAGSSLAILLGRCGLRVELFEKASFPREKPCGEGIMPAGVAALSRLGLAEAVGGVPFYGVRYYLDNRIAEGRFPRVDGLPATGLAQRRLRLDKLLFDTAASTSGVTAHTRQHVDAPILDGGRVIGLTVDGKPHYATLVIAADGLHSGLRRQLGLDGSPSRRWRVGLRTHYQLASGQEQPPWVEVFIGCNNEMYVAPLPHGEILVAGLADRSAIGHSPETTFATWIEHQPVLKARLQGAQRLTALMGMSPLAQRPRARTRPGAILLGDAAGFIDPITGGGITQALLTAELLAAYLARDVQNIAGWLQEYDRACSMLLRDYTLLTQFMLMLTAHRWMAQAMMRIVVAWPGLFSHLIGVAGGIRKLL